MSGCCDITRKMEEILIVPELTPENNETEKSARYKSMMEEKIKFDQEVEDAERKFHETVAVVEGNPLFTKFLSEYEKMHSALGRSKDHIQKMVGQFEEYESEFLANVSITEQMTVGLNEDAQLILSLKEQIREAEFATMQSTKNEDDYRNQVRQAKVDILNLTNTIKQGVGLSALQEKNLSDLTNAKETLAKEIEMEMDKIVNKRSRISEMTEKNRFADLSKRNLDSEIFNLKEKSAVKKREIDTEQRNKDRLENELRELRAVITLKSQEVRNKQDAVNRATDDITIFESHIKNQKLLLEKLKKDQDSLQARTSTLKDDYEVQYREANLLTEENEQLFQQLKEKENDLAAHRAEIKKVSKIKEILIKRNRKLEETKVIAELERKTLRQSCLDLTKKVDEYKKIVDSEKKKIDDLMRERDIINNNQTKAVGDSQHQTSLISILKQARHNMNLDIVRLTQEVDEYTKNINIYQAEKDQLITEAIEIQGTYVQSLGIIKEKELMLYDYKKQISACETKIKHQHNLYESVLSDRKLHAKHLLEAQAEIAEMKRKLKIMNFGINGSKEEIHAKDIALNKEAAEVAKITKDIEAIHEEIKNLKSQQELAQTYIRTQSSERAKLARFAKEAETEKNREEKALNALISERDNLSAQLMRQNEELSKVYDRIKTLQSSLNRGEIYYNEKCKVIGNIRLDIINLRKQHRSLLEETENLGELKQHLINVETELTQEKIRLKALEEELKHPMNVHRWRKMEGSNPQEFEYMQMLQSLQKKLISLSKDDEEKQSLISKKEELYLHLKGLLAKQVGPEALEQVQEFETILKDKNLQLKHMSAELHMYQAQVREYRYSISQADKSLEDLKKETMKKYNSRMTAFKNENSSKPIRIKSALKKPKISEQNSQSLETSPFHTLESSESPIPSDTVESLNAQYTGTNTQLDDSPQPYSLHSPETEQDNEPQQTTSASELEESLDIDGPNSVINL